MHDPESKLAIDFSMRMLEKMARLRNCKRIKTIIFISSDLNFASDTCITPQSVPNALVFVALFFFLFELHAIRLRNILRLFNSLALIINPFTVLINDQATVNSLMFTV